MSSFSMDAILQNQGPQRNNGAQGILPGPPNRIVHNTRPSPNPTAPFHPLLLELPLNPVPDHAHFRYPSPQQTPSPVHIQPSPPLHMRAQIPLYPYMAHYFRELPLSPPYSPPGHQVFGFSHAQNFGPRPPPSSNRMINPLRSRYSQFQVACLKRRYAMHPFMTTEEMDWLACYTHLTHHQVKTWFQNQRHKERKKCVSEGKPLPAALMPQPKSK